MPRPNDRTQVHRHPERGTDDPETVRRILDDALTCTVAWVDADGRPRALPTIHARIADILYLHGSRAARAWKTAAAGAELCVVATVIDELVLARTSPHHSMNYRSAVVYGTAREVTGVRRAVRGGARDHPARAAGPGGRRGRAGRRRLARDVDRGDAAWPRRAPRSAPGPPIDDPGDLELDVWAGTLPLRTITGTPIPPPTSGPGSSRPRTSTGTGVRDRRRLGGPPRPTSTPSSRCSPKRSRPTR